jgi:ABC-type multidrug transport system fused ATPase/permease subunit
MQLKRTLPMVERYISLLKILPRQDTKFSFSKSNGAKIKSLELKDVHFQYGDEPPVLKGIDLAVKAGEKILIKGPSGQGKSTLFSLLCGLNQPICGEIRVNDTILDEKTFYGMRSECAFVSPDVYLFRGTLRDNLSIGVDPSDKLLSEAIQLAGLQQTVTELPEGLDTDIGTNGGRLSLGQRQRVVLARLFLRRPSLVLLDEATANLDRELEELVIANIDQFISPEAIVIMIAHKEPIGYRYSRNITIQSGQIFESETPESTGAASKT